MHRHSHWELSLSNYFDSVAFKPFKWGFHDCSLFMADAVLAMTGDDVAAPFREKYNSAESAEQALKDYGAGTLTRTLNAIFGKSKHIAQVKRGDVVMYDGAVGICCGTFSRFIGSIDESSNVIVADGSEPVAGLVPIATRLCKRAWTVAF